MSSFKVRSCLKAATSISNADAAKIEARAAAYGTGDEAADYASALDDMIAEMDERIFAIQKAANDEREKTGNDQGDTPQVKPTKIDLRGKKPGDVLVMDNGAMYRIEGIDSKTGRLRTTRNPNQLNERSVMLGQDEYDRIFADDQLTRQQAQAAAAFKEQEQGPADLDAMFDDVLAEEVAKDDAAKEPPKPERVANAKRAQAGPRAMTNEGRAVDGMPINGGDVFSTSSGRTTTPYPKQKSERYATQWLIDNAVAEAEARGDDFNARGFKAETVDKSGSMPPASIAAMQEYLFGEQPAVVPSILNPLGGKAALNEVPAPSLAAKEQDEKTLQSAMKSAGWKGETGDNDTIWTKQAGGDRYIARLTPSNSTMEVTVLVDAVDTQIASFKADDAKAAAAAANKAVADDVAESEANTPVPTSAKRTKADRAAADAEAARADYFTPGNIVNGYGGLDEVLSYKATSTGGFSVTVQRVNKIDGEWVREGRPDNARTHATRPEPRELKTGPVERLPFTPGGQVKYTDSRADGKPFPNVPDRGVAPVTAVAVPSPAVSAKEEKQSSAPGRFTNIEVPASTVNWLGFDGPKNARADLAALAQRHPEYYDSPDEVRQDIDFVLGKPDGWYIHKGNRVVLFRERVGEGAIPQARVEVEADADTMAVRSVYVGGKRQIAKKMADKRGVLGGLDLGGQSPESLTVADYLSILGKGSSRPDSPSGESLKADSTVAKSEAGNKRPSTSTQPAIEDFGEKLTGARKDYAALLKDAEAVDVSAEPLSKSWPEPDYQKLLASGVDPFVVGWVRASRDEVPTKPQKGWKLKGWVESVKLLRSVSGKLLDGSITKDVLTAQLGEAAFRNVRDNVGGRAELYQAVGHEKSLKGLRLTSHSYTFYKGQEYPRPGKTLWHVEQAVKATAFGNWPREIVTTDTREQAVAAFKEKFAGLDLGSKVKAKPSFVIYSKRGQPGAFIGKKIGREYVDLHKAEDLKAARAYLEGNTEALEQALARYKDTPYERSDDNAPRVGADHRRGALVTPQVFSEAFGFRGVQFGNYVEQGRRQSDLNEAFDALMDMAAVLELPPRALSLGGRLGLAFGARGRGGKNAPAAHYEPGLVVINLTKGGGPGSLAHEWFHAMDNYFAKEGGTSGFMTDKAKGDALRAEMRTAFLGIRRALQVSGVKTRSVELDKRRSKPYWSTPEEMAARTFESYVIAKLQDQSASNDYLANVVSQQSFEAADSKRLGAESEAAQPATYPYPTEQEMGKLRTVYDEFFKTVQTKQDDDGNTVMFALKPTLPASKGQRAAQTQDAVDAITKAWQNGPEIIVVRDMQDPDVPETVRNYDERQRSLGADGTPEGFYFKGKVYVVASMMRNANDVARVVFHEALGHFGLQNAFGSALKPILKQVATMRAAEVKAKAESYGLDVTVERQMLLAAEEVLAEMAQTRPEIGFVRRAIAAIRTWLRQNVPAFNNLRMTDDEIVRNFILPAREFVERGRSVVDPDQATGALAPALSRSAMNSVEANIKRGTAAMNKAILEKSDANRAMFRPGIGWVDFVWGDGKKGLQHIISRRQQSDGMTVDQATRFLTGKVVDVIATGKELRRTEVGGSVRLALGLEGAEVSLVRRAGSNGWVLTAFELEPDSSARSATQSPDTQNTPIRSRRELGAGESILSGEPGVVNSDAEPMLSRGAVNKAMTGFELLSSGGQREGFDSTRPTQPAATPTRNGLGADDNQIVASGESDDTTMFSRATDPRDPNTFSTKTTDVFNDLMATTKTFNGWWHKTVGTQYNKAEKDREFKRVYDATQAYIGDVSKLANDAADLARDLLPRLDKLGDVFKGGAKDADVKAIGKAIFQGTLGDKRQYKPEELKRVFGLTDTQIKLYQQFRAATNKSLDVLTASTVAKILENGGFRKAQFQEAIDAADHRAMLRMVEGVAKRDPKAKELAEQVREISERADQLQGEGYAPLMRFGQFAVSARDVNDGTLQEFYLFESQFQANRKARELEASGKFRVDRSLMSQEDFKLLGGISPESLELFGDVLAKAGVMDARDEVLDAFIRNAVAQRSAMKRMLERVGYPGYSTDVRRVLAAFITSNARLASKNLHFSDMLGAAESISKSKGDVRDEATKLVTYVQNPEEEAAGVRGLLFVKYIGGSVASALVNMTQSLTMTLPYLSQFSNPVKATATLTNAMAEAAAGVTDPELKKAMAKAEQSGLVSPQEIHHLNAEAMKTLGSQPAIQKTLFVWGSMFGLAEQYNRRVAFIAGWNTAVAKGEKDPYAFAQKAVEETQGVYNKGNRPNWARGAVGATIFTFKQFSISYLEFLSRLPNREKALALAILMLAAGVEGLPFADDLDDVIDTVAQKMGYSFNSKQEKRRFLAGVLGQGGAEFALKGMSAIPGMPIDVAGRMGMANLLPGTGVLREDVRDHMGDVFEFLGPAGGVAKDLISKNIVPTSALDLANNAIAPTAVRNLAQAIDMFQTGKYRDKDGRKVVDVAEADAAMKAIGFQPATVAQDSLQSRMEMQNVNLAKNVEQSIARDWAMAQFEGDAAGVQAARQRLREWNEKNPDQRISINTAQIAQRLRQMRQSRADRIIKSAPKELRPGVREALL